MMSPFFYKLRYFVFLLIVFALIGLAGCGGGGGGTGGGGGGGGSPSDFTLTVTPANLALSPGSSAPVSLLATPVNGFTASVSVQVSGVPSGITVSPTSVTLQPGTAQQVTVAATSSAGVINTTLTFTGTAGSTSHNAPLPLSVAAALLPSRTHYVRVDSATEYFGSINLHWTVYEPTTNRLFVTDPNGNHVFVMDPGTETLIATLDVPGAFGMDDTPDHTKIYVGTLLGDVYTIDPLAMTVTGRFLASHIGPFGFNAFSAVVMSDGRLALLGAAGGIPSVDGSTAFAIWNPVDNSIVIYSNTPDPGGPPITNLCPMGNIGGFTRTADRTKVLVISIDSDSTLCAVNASNGTFNFTHLQEFVTKVSVSPDGKYLAARDFQTNSLMLLDANTLSLLTEFPVAGDLSSAASIAFSADSTTVFVSSPTIVYAYSVSSHQQIGWLPNLVVEPVSGGFDTGPVTGPDIVAVGNSGLLAGPMEEGVGFLDISAMHTGPVGSQFLNGYTNPSFGPPAGGTTVTLSNPNASVNSVYFGGQRSPSVSASGGLLSMTTPPGSAGPVDVDVLLTNGGQWLLPEGFSYGPTILEVTPNASTAEGGGIGIVYGYGFGSAGSNTVPSDLQVTVGGQTAVIKGYTGNAYGLLSPPFQLEAFAYTIPPGTAGSSVDVTVKNSSGSATAHAAMSYLPVTQVFTAGATTLAQGIYDPHRDVYYFSDANVVRVFSRTQGKFLSSINISPPGLIERLWGIALSPDGSKLAIADIAANVIYLLNPDTPTVVKTFPLPSTGSAGILSDPVGVAVSDAGFVYYVVIVNGGFGFDHYFKLDTSSGAVTDYKITGPDLDATFLRTVISADNARVYFNSEGAPFSIDTATDKVVFAQDGPGCCNGDDDLAFSSNQTRFAATSFLYDADLNGESTLTVNDREALNISYVFGSKLSPDGSLLFQPSTLGIDVFDGRLGVLRNRIALPFDLSVFYDALVADGKDNVLVAIAGQNGNQIAIIDLTSLPEPSPLPYASNGPSAPIFKPQAINEFRPQPVNGARNDDDKLPHIPPFGVKIPHTTPSTPAVNFWSQ